MWPAPFVILLPAPAAALVGGRLAADVGEDERWWPFTPLTAAWPKGGGGRFIFWVWGVGFEIAVAIVSAPAAQAQGRQ